MQQTEAIRQLYAVRDELLTHEVYGQMTTPDRVRIMMKHHVFAVWDFMSLLKRLQQGVTSVTVPWLPYPNPEYTRFVNEIVLGEESDEDGQGGYISHFELYLQAMEEAGADQGPIQAFLAELTAGKPYEEALHHPSVPKTAREFVAFNLRVALTGELHEVAAVFFYGREGLIPDMFRLLLASLEKKGASSKWLDYYLRRHIELDEDEHGPLAERLLVSLCGNDPKKLEEAYTIAQTALQMRGRLWDGVVEEIEKQGL